MAQLWLDKLCVLPLFGFAVCIFTAPPHCRDYIFAWALPVSLPESVNLSV